jgi:hypothetical protein
MWRDAFAPFVRLADRDTSSRFGWLVVVLVKVVFLGCLLLCARWQNATKQNYRVSIYQPITVRGLPNPILYTQTSSNI